MKKVLIVDDDALTRSRVMEAIEELGLEDEIVAVDQEEAKKIGIVGGMADVLQNLSLTIKSHGHEYLPCQKWFVDKRPRRRGQRKGSRNWD